MTANPALHVFLTPDSAFSLENDNFGNHLGLSFKAFSFKSDFDARIAR